MIELRRDKDQFNVRMWSIHICSAWFGLVYWTAEGDPDCTPPLPAGYSVWIIYDWSCRCGPDHGIYPDAICCGTWSRLGGVIAAAISDLQRQMDVAGVPKPLIRRVFRAKLADMFVDAPRVEVSQ